MSRSPILFRCDGTPENGWEPFYQCMTLAQAIQRRRRPTYFFSQLEPANLSLTVHRGGHDWVPAVHPVGSMDDLSDTIQQARELDAAAVVVVAQNVGEEYLRELTAAGLLAVSVDPSADIDFPNRLVFNPFFGVGPENYRLAKGTQLLTGPRFSLIRGMIRRIRPIRSIEPPTPFRGLIALGDDNLDELPAQLAKELLELPKVEKITIVARSHHPKHAEFKELAASEPDRLEVVGENNEVSTRLTRAHFALTSGDSWSCEMACLGLPQLIMTTQPRYEINAQRLYEEGAAQYLGAADKVSMGQLRSAVNELLVDSQERRSMTRIGRQLIDGRGTDRFVNGVEILLHVAPAEPITIPLPSLVEQRRQAA